jgi:hypothetical protein
MICNHPDRTNIESAILSGQKIEIVRKHYGLLSDDQIQALDDHLRVCATYVLSLDDFDKEVHNHLIETNGTKTSIQRTLKLKEADILGATVHEYLITLKNLGRKINKWIDDPDDSQMPRLIRKPIADMYIQLGGEIRQNVRTMAELDKLLNGDDDKSLTGLAALANAIAGTKPTPVE